MGFDERKSWEKYAVRRGPTVVRQTSAQNRNHGGEPFVAKYFTVYSFVHLSCSFPFPTRDDGNADFWALLFLPRFTLQLIAQYINLCVLLLWSSSLIWTVPHLFYLILSTRLFYSSLQPLLKFSRFCVFYNVSLIPHKCALLSLSFSFLPLPQWNSLSSSVARPDPYST